MAAFRALTECAGLALSMAMKVSPLRVGSNFRPQHFARPTVEHPLVVRRFSSSTTPGSNVNTPQACLDPVHVHDRKLMLDSSRVLFLPLYHDKARYITISTNFGGHSTHLQYRLRMLLRRLEVPVGNIFSLAMWWR